MIDPGTLRRAGLRAYPNRLYLAYWDRLLLSLLTTSAPFRPC